MNRYLLSSTKVQTENTKSGPARSVLANAQKRPKLRITRTSSTIVGANINVGSNIRKMTAKKKPTSTEKGQGRLSTLEAIMLSKLRTDSWRLIGEPPQDSLSGMTSSADTRDCSRIAAPLPIFAPARTTQFVPIKVSRPI